MSCLLVSCDVRVCVVSCSCSVYCTREWSLSSLRRAWCLVMGWMLQATEDSGLVARASRGAGGAHGWALPGRSLRYCGVAPPRALDRRTSNDDRKIGGHFLQLMAAREPTLNT